MSELALKLIKEAKDKRLTRLDLGNCGLTELPDELFELTWLEDLDLNDNFYLYNLSPIAELVNLKSLTIYKTSVSNLHPIAKLIDLDFLCFSQTNVCNIKPLENLLKLYTLIMSETEVSDISPLRNLVNLHFLNISDTKVVDLSPSVGLLNLIVLKQVFIYNSKPLCLAVRCCVLLPITVHYPTKKHIGTMVLFIKVPKHNP